MNVGLPGAGIGGLYYLICAAIMPVKELFLSLTKTEHKFRYRIVFTQLSIASIIILGFFAIYQLLNSLLGANLSLPTSTGGDTLLFNLFPIVISFALLILILTIVELFSFFSKKKKAVAIKK